MKTQEILFVVEYVTVEGQTKFSAPMNRISCKWFKTITPMARRIIPACEVFNDNKK